MFRRTIVSDVVQGIIIGRVLVESDSDLLTAYWTFAFPGQFWRNYSR